MKPKRLIALFMITFLSVGLFQGTGTIGAAASPAFTISKTSFIRGETAVFKCENADSSMHISIMNEGYKNYVYSPTGEKGDRRTTIYCTANELTYITQNLQPGNYVAVLFGEGWYKYQEIAFSVVADPNAPDFSVDKSRYTKGEKIIFSFKNVQSDYYIAILNDGYKNYTADPTGENGDRLATIFCKSATCEFSTDSIKGGKYAAVLFKSGWVAIKEIVIEITDPNKPKSFSLDKDSYTVGETLHYTFDGAVSGDYVAVFPTPRKNYNVRYGYKVLGARPASYEFSTESLPAGNYVVTLFDNYGSWKVLKDIYITVSAAAPEKKISLSVSKIGFGQSISFLCENTEPDDEILICRADYSGSPSASAAARALCESPTFDFSSSPIPSGNYVALLCEGGENEKILRSVTFEIADCINDGDTITVYNDVTLKLSEEDHNELDGKLFLGWRDSDGNAVSSIVALKRGSVLNAAYADFSTDKGRDFIIDRVEIRTAKEIGLRYVIKQSSALTKMPGISVTESGTIVLPSVILDDDSNGGYSPLEYGRTYVYNSVKYTPAVIPADRIYEETEDEIFYTACIVGLDLEKYTRQYTARGYIRYLDLNGMQRLAYTKECSANPFAAAKQTLEYGSLSDSSKAKLNDLVSAVTVSVRSEWNKKSSVLFGNAENENSLIYRLENGIQVREVSVNTGKGGAQLEVIQITDFHLKESTYRDSVPLLRKLMKLSASADKVILTGDTIHSLSDFSLNMLRKEIWDFNPNAWVTLGNHDWVNNEGLSQSLSLEKLQKAWDHDIYYSSEVLGNKLMLIQMDNSEHTFRPCQKEPMQRDLKQARENGYTVLLFVHVPLCTRNPDEKKVISLRGNTAGMDFCTNKFLDFVGSPNMPEGATKDVYTLITDNADIIRGVFNGHTHNDYYTEICGRDPDGSPVMIPQYTLSASSADGGMVLKITVD